jgi:hypothetical protein
LGAHEWLTWQLRGSRHTPEEERLSEVTERTLVLSWKEGERQRDATLEGIPKGGLSQKHKNKIKFNSKTERTLHRRSIRVEGGGRREGSGRSR